MKQVSIGHGKSALQVLVFDSPETMGEHVAQMILAGIRAARKAGLRR